MCPWGAPSSISRNSPPLLAALLLNSRRRRRSLPFFSFRPFPSRFPSVLADSVLGESRLASSERSNIGPGRCSLALFTLALFFCSVSSSAHPSHQRAPLLSLSPFLSLPSARLSSPLFSSHPLTALRRTSSSSSFLLYSPAPSTVPLVPSSPFFLLSFLPVPTRHYLLSLAFVASPWQYRDDGRRGTESEKRKGPFSLALFPSMGRDNHWPVFFLSFFLFFRALSSCTKDFLGFTLREIFSIDRGIAFTSRSLSRYLWRFIFPLYEREMMRVRMIEIDDHHHPWRRLHFRLSSSVTTRNDKLRFHGGNGS